jgi:hypothetical protein
MDSVTLSKLLKISSHLGAKGIEVVGWSPPSTASSDPMGVLCVIPRGFNSQAGGDTPWYDEKVY